MNNHGEFVMTLKPVENIYFTELSKSIMDNSLPVKKKLHKLTSQLNLNLNDTTFLQIMVPDNRFTKIDEIIKNVLNTIRMNN